MIHEVGVRLSLRQRVISTAQVLFKRFYLSASFSSFDPRLVAPTLLFVSAKVEECPLNAKVVIAKLNKLDAPVSSASGANPAHLGLAMPTALLINASAPTAAAAAASSTWSAAASSTGAVAAPSSSSSSSKPPSLPYLYSVEDLLEMEFAVMSGLGYDLIVYHPYRSLMQSVIDTEGRHRRSGGGGSVAAERGRVGLQKGDATRVIDGWTLFSLVIRSLLPALSCCAPDS